MQLNRLHIMSILLGLIMAIRFIMPSYAFAENCKTEIADMAVCHAASSCADGASCCCTPGAATSGEGAVSENLGSCCCMAESLPATQDVPSLQTKVPSFRFDKSFQTLLSAVILLTAVAEEQELPVLSESDPLAYSSRRILALHSVLRI